MAIDDLEAAVNEVSDKDWSWWPFLWLRPEKTEQLSFGRIATMSLLYGVPLALLLELGIKLQYAATQTEIIATALFFPVLFLVMGTVVVAPMWNRRSDRLRARSAAGFNA